MAATASYQQPPVLLSPPNPVALMRGLGGSDEPSPYPATTTTTGSSSTATAATASPITPGGSQGQQYIAGSAKKQYASVPLTPPSSHPRQSSTATNSRALQDQFHSHNPSQLKQSGRPPLSNRVPLHMPSSSSSDSLGTRQVWNRPPADLSRSYSTQRNPAAKPSPLNGLGSSKGLSSPELRSPKSSYSGTALINLESLLQELQAARTNMTVKPQMSQIMETDVYEEEWVADDPEPQTPNSQDGIARGTHDALASNPSIGSQSAHLRRNRVSSYYGDIMSNVNVEDGAAVAKATLVVKMGEVTKRRQLRQGSLSENGKATPPNTHGHPLASTSSLSHVSSASLAKGSDTEPALQPPPIDSYNYIYQEEPLYSKNNPDAAKFSNGRDSNSSDTTIAKSVSNDTLNHPNAKAKNLESGSISTLSDSQIGNDGEVDGCRTPSCDEIQDDHNAQAEHAICAFCEEPIHDRPTFLLGRHWHRDHSRCHECRRPIGVDNFIEIGSFLYCEDHYLKVNGKFIIRRESDKTKYTPVEAELSQIKQHSTVRKVRNLFTFEKAVKVNMLTVMEERTRNGRSQRSVMSWMPKDGHYENELKQIAELDLRRRSVYHAGAE
ncbi:hypothetical protein BSLG_000384 [Batrachochytrium salamandrivorans]|nr:hypothetical protein BSLG_000384 [Batrachochytrium salamandrivorans]